MNANLSELNKGMETFLGLEVEVEYLGWIEREREREGVCL